MYVEWGGALSAAFGRFWCNRDLKSLRAGFSPKKTVAGSEPGGIKFPGVSRWLRVVSVARSAYSRYGIAAEQAHAPDRGHDGFHVPSWGRAAGDAGRYVASSTVSKI